MAFSSSSINWVYDVFLSFRGEDVRVTFRSHFLKELDRKLITAFKDNEIEKSRPLWPELVQAIRNSRIAVVIFSKSYASSSWCLNELLEIVNCKDRIVIPVFYGLDPSDVRKQTGDFGRMFEETCKKNTEEVKNQWQKALTDVANMHGFHSATWDNEAKMIEDIANDVLGKLLLTSSKYFENFVGIEDHVAKISVLLQLESEEVKMVGIWTSSGIGKTSIARALFNKLSRHFHVSKFIDKAFAYKSREIYSRANPDDHMKLHFQDCFLSEILRLQHQKVLIIIDGLDDQVTLDSLVDQTQWFGSGSRIIVVTNNKHFLRAYRIDPIYEVSFPTEVHAFKILSKSAFKRNYALEGFWKLVVDVTRHAGSLPLGRNVLCSYLRGSYDGICHHIACLFFRFLPHGIILAVVVALVVLVPFSIGDGGSEAITDAIAELLSPVGLFLFPIILLLTIQFLSSERGSFVLAIFSTGELESIHRVSGSPVGVALFIVLILFLLYNRFSMFGGDDDSDD